MSARNMDKIVDLLFVFPLESSRLGYSSLLFFQCLLCGEYFTAYASLLLNRTFCQMLFMFDRERQLVDFPLHTPVDFSKKTRHKFKPN